MYANQAPRLLSPFLGEGAHLSAEKVQTPPVLYYLYYRPLLSCTTCTSKSSCPVLPILQRHIILYYAACTTRTRTRTQQLQPS